ncbi:MAG: polysaccharide pyruvyl transferase family protein [Deltaproteobacteria bacterium]|jgi:hypothetical protein|nr:polysaccharide pyruvyl transferase family protein [Deltaproteobacteria bacterium]
MDVMHKRLNILVSSTRQWNPGDEFIRFGVFNLLEALLGKDHNFLLWNRNPDLFVNGYANNVMRNNFLSNCCKPKEISLADLVVFAGTPEWFDNTVHPVFDFLFDHPTVPAIFLGIGAGMPLDRLRSRDIAVLKRDNVYISTRSAGLARNLNDLMGINKAVDLPCPSLFCVQQDFQKRFVTGATKKVGIILQAARVINQSISPEIVKNILATFPSPTDAPEFICFYIDEFLFYSKAGYACRYSFEPMDYFSIINDYETIISTRLHGAIPALAMNRPAMLLTSENNVRIRSTQKLYEKYLPITDSLDVALDWVNAFGADNSMEYRNKLALFIEKMFGRYVKELKNYFDSIAPASLG